MALTQNDPSIHTQRSSVAGKTVLISGGTAGIGRAIAGLLAAEGANVFVFGRHDADLRQTLEELGSAKGRVRGILADQARAQDVRRVFEEVEQEFGPVEIMINNAGLSAGAITEGNDDEWRYQIAVNLNGYIDCARHAVAQMKKRGGGHIVNIGSIAALHASEGLSLYTATKAGVEGFTRALRKEVSEDNIKVSVIEPGAVGTEIWEGEERGDPAVQREEEKRGTMLKPEDIAVAVHYCLTQPARCTVSMIRIQPAR